MSLDVKPLSDGIQAEVAGCMLSILDDNALLNNAIEHCGGDTFQKMLIRTALQHYRFAVKQRLLGR